MTTLQSLTAADLMSPKVIALPTNASIREAIATFEDEHITGAPVVDATGRAVGFLTTHDITRTEHIRGSRLDTERGDDGLADADAEEGGADDGFYGREDYSSTVLGEVEVEDWMSPGIISVAPGDDLKTVCSVLLENGVHRVLVMEGDKILGLVTTFDVVQHLAETL